MITQFINEYRWLSNFTEVPVEWEGKRYRSVEHAYQAAKSPDKKWRSYCASELKARKVRKASRHIKVREDWQAVKVGIMKELLIQKFNHPEFKSLLLATSNKYLIEGNTWKDTFWGVDLRTGEGSNKLGHLLMEIRDSLQ